MKIAQKIRITLLLLLIFAAGIATGRFTVSSPPTLVPTVGGGFMTAESVGDRLTRDLGLDAKQQKQFRALLQQEGEEMAKTQPGTRARLEVFRSYVPRLRALLRPDQHEAFDRMVRRAERQFERLIRDKQ